MPATSNGLASLAMRLARLAQLTRRALTLVTALPLVVLLAIAHGALAQEAYPQGAPLDPPVSVASLSLTEGAVSFAPSEAGANAWTPAALNRPLTRGDRLWTGPRPMTAIRARRLDRPHPRPRPQ